jgi:hypothetical protein
MGIISPKSPPHPTRTPCAVQSRVPFTIELHCDARNRNRLIVHESALDGFWHRLAVDLCLLGQPSCLTHAPQLLDKITKDVSAQIMITHMSDYLLHLEIRSCLLQHEIVPGFDLLTVLE